MSLPEDSYGRVKRLDFIGSCIRSHSPARILDVGCGAGTQLTEPLAAAFPDIEITAVDEDEGSLAWARHHAAAPNIRFLAPTELPREEVFDLVIASEVLEHVAAPDAFLRALRDRLSRGGRLLLTVPNGYGAFEWMALSEVLLNLSGVQRVLRRIKRRGRADADGAAPMTLANSPHINFFSYSELARLFADLGFTVARYQARTVLCGYLIDSALRRPSLVALNASLADRLPAWCVSDWMFELLPADAPGNPHWRRGAWARLRKRLNERRWRV